MNRNVEWMFWVVMIGSYVGIFLAGLWVGLVAG
jgi:hypothetical protein